MSGNKLIPCLALGLSLVSVQALADHDRNSRYDRYGGYDRNAGSYGSSARYARAEYFDARVVSVVPLHTRVRVSEPIRECWDEVRYVPDGPLSQNHAGSTLLGGLIGGVVGNQIGSGRGRRIATATGAIVGGAIGHQASQNRRGYATGREVVERRCDTRYQDSWQERIDAYDVTYVYGGRHYTTRMPYDPGDRMRVRVDVAPAGR